MMGDDHNSNNNNYDDDDVVESSRTFIWHELAKVTQCNRSECTQQ